MDMSNKYRERWKIKNEENICVDLHEPSKHWCISKSHKAAELGITPLRQGVINCVRWDGKAYLRRRAFRMLLRNDSGHKCVLRKRYPSQKAPIKWMQNNIHLPETPSFQIFKLAFCQNFAQTSTNFLILKHGPMRALILYWGQWEL